jgi:hypothetical protein
MSERKLGSVLVRGKGGHPLFRSSTAPALLTKREELPQLFRPHCGAREGKEESRRAALR